MKGNTELAALDDSSNPKVRSRKSNSSVKTGVACGNLTGLVVLLRSESVHNPRKISFP